METMPKLFAHPSSVLPQTDVRSTRRGMIWTEWHDIDSELVLLQSETIESDHPVYLFLRLLYWDEFVPESEMPAKYNVELFAASPGFVGEDEKNSACSCVGMDREEFDKLAPDAQAWVLAEYGTKATLWSQDGNNKRDLIRAAKREAMAVNVLFGFYMDKQCNAIGNNGWDFIRGDIGFKSARVQELIENSDT